MVFLIHLFILWAQGETTVSSTPSSTPGEKSCVEQLIEKDRRQVGFINSYSRQALEQEINLARTSFNKTKEFLDLQYTQLQASKNACEKQQTLQYALDAIHARRSVLSKAPDSSGYEGFRDTLAIPELSIKISCLLSQLAGKPFIYDNVPSREIKLKLCGFTSSEVKLFSENFVLDEKDRLILTGCPLFTRMEEQQYANQLKSSLKLGHEALNKMVQDLKNFSKNPVIDYFLKTLADEEKKFLALKPRPAPACDDSFAHLSRKVQNATQKVTNGTGKGSAFLTETSSSSEKIYRFSAQHVIRDSKKFDINDWRPLYEFPRQDSSPAMDFPIAPGLFNYSNDTAGAAIPRTSSSAPLPLIQEGSRPEPNQTFYVGGYPGAYGGDFHLFPCRFIGYNSDGQGLKTAPTYVVHCPTMDKKASGASGGPLVDDRGRVWGVNQAGMEDTGIMFISPLFSSSKGTIVNGIQQPFVSENCFKANSELERYKCQVTPPGYENI